MPGIDHDLALTDRNIGLHAVVVDQKACSDQVIDRSQGELRNDLDALFPEISVLFRIVEQPDLLKLIFTVPQDLS